jgi:hypothetical protein
MFCLEKVHDDNACLHVCGLGLHGIGINDMTKEAKKVSDNILRETRSPKGEAGVKGVYF